MRSCALMALSLFAFSAHASLEASPGAPLATAALVFSSGEPAGTAELAVKGEGVYLSVALAGMDEGIHGLHLHMTGQCEAPSFQSAGGHLNPEGRQHGTDNPQGSHLGDLPNIAINATGNGIVMALLPGTRDAIMTALFDADGTAVVVHAGPDDYRTDPSGDSGARIACGVLRQI